MNINKYGIGKVKKARKNGKIIERTDQVMMMLPNGRISFCSVVPDDDHFIYQNQVPMTRDDVILKYNGILPPDKQGPTAMCTCGSDAVLLLEGPYANHVICRTYLVTGFHQTSHKIRNGKLEYNRKTVSERIEDPEKIIEEDIKNKKRL